MVAETAKQSNPITVYTTPTCPWCARAKEFLQAQGADYREVDVSRDPRAAQELVSRTGQMGVPVIADDQEVIVGFDPRRLQQMAARHRRGPSLGLKVADATATPGGGALVGDVKPGGPGARAGLQTGDVIVEMSGVPIQSVDDLARVSKNWQPGRMTSMVVQRGPERVTLFLT